MILDKLTVFDWQAALTATRASTDSLDLVNARDLGFSYGTEPELIIRTLVTTALVSGGSSTLTLSFQGSTDGNTWTTYVSSPAIAKADLVAGYRYDMAWAPRLSGGAMPQYIRMYYTVGTTDFTAGALSSFVVLGVQNNHAYPQAVNVQN